MGLFGTNYELVLEFAVVGRVGFGSGMGVELVLGEF